MFSQIVQSKPGRISELSRFFIFDDSNHKSFLLNKENTNGRYSSDEKPEDGFSVNFSFKYSNFKDEETVLEIPGVLKVKLRQADPYKRDSQNYPTYKLSDNLLPVLEAAILLHAPINRPFKQEMVIGVPLAILDNPEVEHNVVLSFTDSKWSMYIDNELLDVDFPIGYPHINGTRYWEINTKYVNDAKIFFPALGVKRDISRKSELNPTIQYWTPPGHNAWVGDVATIFYNERYHVFYLYDRRHHSSKFGAGGHYFEHFSTKDFITWTEHEAATPIEKQWETFGTGTPFVYNDKLSISYGYHTSRIYPDNMTIYPIQMEYLKKNGETGFFTTNSYDVIPSGASYSVSSDGISNFVKSGKLIHHSENPSIYNTSDNKFFMIANYRTRGIWMSDSLNGGWKVVNEDFPPGGDCTFYYKWGNYEYIIGGFVNLWMRSVNDSGNKWIDIVEQGLDFYNGINVPSITEINDGRFLMAGWLPIRGWGGPFVIHEMIQYPNGRIGTKWMKELVPETTDLKLLAEKLENKATFDLNDESFIISFDVIPVKANKGKFALSFLSLQTSQSENDCEFQIDLKEDIAQYSNSDIDNFANREKTLNEGASPQNVYNYAINNLIDVGKPFKVRMMIKNNSKFGGTIIDTEIAEQRTMITFRPDLTADKLAFKLEDITIKNVHIEKVID